MVIAPPTEAVEPAAAACDHLVGGVRIREPGRPARAVLRDGQRRIVVRRSGFGELLLDRKPLNQPVAIEHRERSAQSYLLRAELERARRRSEPDACRPAAAHAQDQPLRDQALDLGVAPVGLPVRVAGSKLVLQVADLGAEIEGPVRRRAVGIGEAPAFERRQLRARDGDAALPLLGLLVGDPYRDAELREVRPQRAPGSQGAKQDSSAAHSFSSLQCAPGWGTKAACLETFRRAAGSGAPLRRQCPG